MEKVKLVLGNKEYSFDLEEEKIFVTIEEMREIFKPYDEDDFVDTFLKMFENEGLIEEDMAKDKKYDINIVIKIALSICPDLAKDIFNQLVGQKKAYVIWNYLFDQVKYFDIPRFDLNYVLGQYSNVFETCKKVKAEQEYRTSCLSFFHADFYLLTLKELKESKHLPEDFGKQVKPNALQKAINDYYSAFDYATAEENAAYLFYIILKARPFVKYNEEIAAYLSLYNLELDDKLVNDYSLKCGLISKNDFVTVKDTDLLLAVKLFEENKNKDKKEVIDLLAPLFHGTEIHENPEEKRFYEILKNNPTYENLVKYVVSFVENYHGQVEGSSLCFSKDLKSVDVNYFADWRNFKLNPYLTMKQNDVLVFDVFCTAKIVAPLNIDKRNNSIINVYEELCDSSYDDVLAAIKNDLFKKLNDLVDFKKFSIQFNPIWHCIIENE